MGHTDRPTGVTKRSNNYLLTSLHHADVPHLSVSNQSLTENKGGSDLTEMSIQQRDVHRAFSDLRCFFGRLHFIIIIDNYGPAGLPPTTPAVFLSDVLEPDFIVAVTKVVHSHN